MKTLEVTIKGDTALAVPVRRVPKGRAAFNFPIDVPAGFECRCSMIMMAPSAGIPYVCDTCQQIISFDKMSAHDRYWGYSGYDEYNNG